MQDRGNLSYEMSIQLNHKFFFYKIMRLCSVKLGKTYVDRLDARKFLDFSLFKTSFEFLMDQNRFLPDLS